MKSFISGLVALSVATSGLPALAGVSGGSGDNGTKLAYDEAALKQAGLDFSLDYLKLKPKDIETRDKKLAQIFGQIDKVNVASAVNTIRATYGSNVYVEGDSCPANIDDVTSRMSAAVTKYFYNSCQFKDADPNEVPYGSLLSASGKVPTMKMSGRKEEFDDERYSESGFLVVNHAYSEHGFCSFSDFFCDHSASYTSSTLPLSIFPIFVRFLKAMRESSLKALDATLVFVKDPVRDNSNDDTSNTYAIYPPYSDLAPIPKAVLVISSQASEDEILDFINQNAPRVYAFNKLFDQKVVLVPTQNELMKILISSPDILAEAQKVKRDATREEVARALHVAFLGISYGLLAAGALAGTVAIIDVVNNALLRPILIRGVVTVLSR